MILCVDPGETTGYAVLNEAGGLYDFGQGAEMASLGFLGIRTIVVEIPKIRPGGPTDSIVTLAMTAGRLVQDLRRRCGVRTAYGIFPERWKGQVPKLVHNKRVLGKLDPDTLALFEQKSRAWAKKDDVIDAIGIALWVRDRMKILASACDYEFHSVGWAA